MAMPRRRTAAVLMVAFALLSTAVAVAARRDGCPSVAGDPSVRPAENLLAGQPWEFGPFVDGGFGTGNREAYKFLWVGVHAGKVLTGPFGKGFLNGQFELGAEFMPLWQAYTPKYLRANCYEQPGGPLNCSNLFPTGGTYTGVSVTPVILRWNLRSRAASCPGSRVRAVSSGPITNSRPSGPTPCPIIWGPAFSTTPRNSVWASITSSSQSSRSPCRRMRCIFRTPAWEIPILA